MLNARIDFLAGFGAGVICFHEPAIFLCWGMLAQQPVMAKRARNSLTIFVRHVNECDRLVTSNVEASFTLKHGLFTLKHTRTMQLINVVHALKQIPVFDLFVVCFRYGSFGLHCKSISSVQSAVRKGVFVFEFPTHAMQLR